MSPLPADKLTSLLKLAHDLGREDRGLAMLGEGNISCRLDADTFLVKASGSSMSNLEEGQLVACRFSSLLPLLKAGPLSDAEVEKILLASG
jgi:ribulose-5-phosphate 4-epimerase/fuculose-1-phosphate aldolase